MDDLKDRVVRIHQELERIDGELEELQKRKEKLKGALVQIDNATKEAFK